MEEALLLNIGGRKKDKDDGGVPLPCANGWQAHEKKQCSGLEWVAQTWVQEALPADANISPPPPVVQDSMFVFAKASESQRRERSFKSKPCIATALCGIEFHVHSDLP